MAASLPGSKTLPWMPQPLFFSPIFCFQTVPLSPETVKSPPILIGVNSYLSYSEISLYIQFLLLRHLTKKLWLWTAIFVIWCFQPACGQIIPLLYSYNQEQPVSFSSQTHPAYCALRSKCSNSVNQTVFRAAWLCFSILLYLQSYFTTRIEFQYNADFERKESIVQNIEHLKISW